MSSSAAKTISWLHFTDLHIGQSNEWLWPDMRQKLYKDLELLSNDGGLKWDLVFFTGDIVDRGSKAEFDTAKQELHKLWEHFRKLGCNPKVAFVPGNHDLSRPEKHTSLAVTARNWDREDEVRKEFWTKPSFWVRKDIEACFENYQNWIDNLDIPQLTICKGLLPGDFSSSVNLDDINIGIVGLNSTFLQILGGDMKGKLDLHQLQLNTVCENNPAEWAANHDVRVLLTHQSREWLCPNGQEEFDQLYDAGDFTWHFCGHMHEPKTSDEQQFGGKIVRCRRGTSLFGKDTYGINDTKRIFGYSTGSWVINSDYAEEIIFPRSAEKSQNTWSLGPDRRYPDLGLNGSYTRHICLNNKNVSLGLLSGSNAIIDLTENKSVELSSEKLSKIPRYPLKHELSHDNVRTGEFIKVVSLLQSHRLVWIVSDWRMGSEGLIGAALNRLGGVNSTEEVFYFNCAAAQSIEELFTISESHTGLSFMTFTALIANLQESTVIFNDIPSNLADQISNRDLLDRARPVLDFCSTTRLIFCSRKIPRRIEATNVVVLKALDIPDTRKYILNHPDLTADLTEQHNIERIHDHTGGLPWHLDRLIAKRQYLDLHDILEDEVVVSALNKDDEPPSESLAQAIKDVEINYPDSYMLLKVLTVLKDGETIDTIRRLYKARSFRHSDLEILIKLSLAESIQTIQSAEEFNGSKSTRPSLKPATLLIRIHRQVRDFVNISISEDERDIIFNAAAELFFGSNWRNGTIKLNNLHLAIREQLSLNGPGNELVVAQYFLQRAKSGRNQTRINRYVNLAIGYCNKLYAADRFRDTSIAAGTVFNLVKDLGDNKIFIEAALVYSKGLRMTNRQEEAVALLKDVISNISCISNKEFKSSIYLNLALAAHYSNANDLAVESANKVLELTHSESDNWFLANSLLAKQLLKGRNRKVALKSLYQRARNLRRSHAANNIAIDLARSGQLDESLKLLNSVIDNSKDKYNLARAIVDKAALLKKRGKLSELSSVDTALLNAAYSYSYTQRMGSILDRCHDVLWNFYRSRDIIAPLFRLFRFSSFWWRFRGDESHEVTYKGELLQINIESLTFSDKVALKHEISYLQSRTNNEV